LQLPQGKEAKENRIHLILKWLLGRLELFHDGNSGYASTVDGIRKTFRLDTGSFEEWLVSILYREYPTLLKGADKADVISGLIARAKHDSPHRAVFTRVASMDRAVYLDLCDEQWRQAKVTSAGWAIVEAKDSPIRFQRFSGMLPLPLPTGGGSINRLRTFLNLTDSHFLLCVAWLLQAYSGLTYCSP
jgi:hypothetical protein